MHGCLTLIFETILWGFLEWFFSSNWSGANGWVKTIILIGLIYLAFKAYPFFFGPATTPVPAKPQW